MARPEAEIGKDLAANLDLVSEGLCGIMDAARFLQVSRSTVYALLGRRELPYVKVGRSMRIPWKALRAYAAKNVRSGPPGEPV